MSELEPLEPQPSELIRDLRNSREKAIDVARSLGERADQRGASAA
jgi:hypothetical protein